MADMDLDLDTMMEDLSTLCKTPPLPRKHPHREFYKYRTSLPPTPQEQPEMEMVGPPMYRFGSPHSELVPKPLFSRSNTLPSQPFRFQSDDIVKSPSPLFSRRNTLPPRFSRYATAEKAHSPLSIEESVSSSRAIRCDSMEPSPTATSYEDDFKVSKRKSFPPRPAHVTTVEYPASLFCRAHARPCEPHFGPAAPTSPKNLTPVRPNNSRKDSFPSRVKRVAAADNCQTPLCGRGSVRAPGPTRFVPLDPPSPIILSPTISNTSSAVSSPTPSLCSTDVDSFCSSTPSTPSSPKFRTPQLTSYFAPTCWTVAPSPTPIYNPRHLLRRKKSPRKDTLRGLRAKESDACLQRIYDSRTSAYLDGFVFPGIKTVLETPEKEFGRMSLM
jgi:hypothetical protein